MFLERIDYIIIMLFEEEIYQQIYQEISNSDPVDMAIYQELADNIGSLSMVDMVIYQELTTRLSFGKKLPKFL